MRPLVTLDEMRRADETAIAAGSPPELLMERAGRAVGGVVLRELGARYGKKVTVVCGSGNNGGDGFVVARMLHLEGLGVVCCTAFDPSEAKGPPADHLDRLRTSGCPVLVFDKRHLSCDLIVDAVFGTGFEGEPRGLAREALAAISQVAQGEETLYGADGSEAAPLVSPPPKIVSIDVSSAGRVPADVTVAIGAEKLETFFRPPDLGGRVEVVDIGIGVHDYEAGVVEEADLWPYLPHPGPDDHKTSHGSVAVLAGSDAITGAPMLSARAAARMGAGYVSLGSTAGVLQAASALLPEILKHEVSDEPDLGAEALDGFAPVLARADALVIGPGSGTRERQKQLVARTLDEVELPLVLDADALNVVAASPELLDREALTVITPHAAELGRLLGIETAEVLRDRLASARAAAERFGCMVVLKGRNTIVVDPTGGVFLPSGRRAVTPSSRRGSASAAVIPVGGAELATAGTGDVLAGAIGALLARHHHPGAVIAACYLHGVAGAVATERIGATGVVAWDVAEALPEAVRRIRNPYPA